MLSVGFCASDVGSAWGLPSSLHPPPATEDQAEKLGQASQAGVSAAGERVWDRPGGQASCRRVAVGELRAAPTVSGGGREAPVVSTGGGPPCLWRGGPLPALSPSTHQAMRWKLAGSCSVTPSGRVTPSFELTLSTSSYCCLSALDGTLTMEASSTSRMLMASALPRWECAQGHMVLACSRLSSLGGGRCHHPFHGGGPESQSAELAQCDPGGKLLTSRPGALSLTCRQGHF